MLFSGTSGRFGALGWRSLWKAVGGVPLRPSSVSFSRRHSSSSTAMATPLEAAVHKTRPEARVLSIQSHVVHGYAGNKAAVFPLQINGFHVDFVNSVQFSNHTGYKELRGDRLDSEQLGALYEGLVLNELTAYSHLLTGYCGNPGFLQRIADIVSDLKKKNPDLVYVCDPVLGDNGEYYTPRELLPVYRDVVVPLADVITPNAFELGELSGRSISSEAECIEGIDAMHDKGVARVVVTSGIPSSDDSHLIAIASTRNEDGSSTRHRFEFPKQEGCFVGTGDMFASLLVVWLEECEGNLAAAVGRVLGALQDVIRVTGEISLDHPPPPSCSLPELRFIEARRFLLQPSIIVPSKSI